MNLPDEFALRQTAARIDNQDQQSDVGTHCVIGYEFENLPNPDSRIVLTEAEDALGVQRIDLQWAYGQADYTCFANAVDAVAREVGATGTGRLCFPIEPEEIILMAGMSRHHMGSTRMHDDPAVGVVDANLKSHDMENLYIAGSSVFPTSGIANPTLTILALVMRLSDHLKQKLGRNMIDFDRRSLLIALGAAALTACDTSPVTLPADHSLLEGLDTDGIKDLAASYLAATQDPVKSAKVRHLFKGGDIDLAALKSAIKTDFEQGNTFRHKGWYLSHTEGKLFTLLSRSAVP